MRWLSMWRDPRIWVVVLLAALVRAGWSLYWTREFERELTAYEADMAKLSPEARLEAELRTADALAREVLGVDLSAELEEVEALQREAIAELQPDRRLAPLGPVSTEFEAALQEVSAPRPPPAAAGMSEIPVIRYEPEPRWEAPPWMIAGAIGGLVLLVGVAGSFIVLGTAPADDEQPPA